MGKNKCYVCERESFDLRWSESSIFEKVFQFKCPVCRFSNLEGRDLVLRVSKYYLDKEGGKIPPWLNKILKEKKYSGERITAEELKTYEL